MKGKLKKGRVFLATIMALGMILGACSNGQETIQPESKTNEVANSEKIQIQDIVGNQITLDKPATKVVGTHNPSLNTAIVLGGGDKYLAGFGYKEMANELYQLVMNDFDGLPSVGKGKNINYEMVASLNADIAILPERFKDDAKEYENVGVKPIVALSNTESFDSIKKSLEIVGQALGEDEKAKKINEFLDEKIKMAEKIAQENPVETSVLFLGMSSPLSVAPDAMIQTQLISTAGAKNAVEGIDVLGSFADVNIEQIIKWNPDVIWVPTYATYKIEDLLSNPEWADITAIKNKQVYTFPSALEPWDYPTASAALGVCWATYNLHPEVYTLENLMTDIDAFYSMVYGQKFTQEQLGLK